MCVPGGVPGVETHANQRVLNLRTDHADENSAESRLSFVGAPHCKSHQYMYSRVSPVNKRNQWCRTGD
jgi:hypothetical protein